MFGPENGCGDCGERWYPRGVDRARACPSCRSSNVYINNHRRGSGCFSLIVILALAYWLYSNFGDIEKILPESPEKAKSTPTKALPEPAKVVAPAPQKVAAPPKKTPPKAPAPVKITVTEQNAVSLARERYEKASQLFREHCFERSEESGQKIAEALHKVTESSQILTKMGVLESFADQTLARHVRSLKNDCERRLNELKALGIEVSSTAKADPIVTIIPGQTTPTEAAAPIVGDKSGYGSGTIYNVKFSLENKSPQIFQAESIQVVFLDAFDLEIGTLDIDEKKSLMPGAKNKYRGRYEGENAARVKTFKVVIKAAQED